MKKLIAVITLALMPLTGMAAGGGGAPLQMANIDLNNHAAIQRGAKLFVNYCMGCHSAKYVRYKLFTKVGLTGADMGAAFGGGSSQPRASGSSSPQAANFRANVARSISSISGRLWGAKV